MKRVMTILASALMLVACNDRVEITSTSDYSPEIFPDYKDVTMPRNMAPLNFTVTDTIVDVLVITVDDESEYVKADNNTFDIDEERWHEMAHKAAGGEMKMTLCHKRDNGYEAYKPFAIKVVEDEIDPYMTYRLVPPGYALWNRMGIYQRNLETFEETCLYDNRYGQGNCVNCHSMCQGNPNRRMFHLRKKLAGTYIVIDGKMKKFGADMTAQLSNPVYPYWHPSGKYIAFSTNKTFQMFHGANPNRIEVGDDASDLIIYDVEKERVVTSEVIASDLSFETFPCFSQDGRSLYYCSAKAIDTVERHYKEVKYSLCRVDFDPLTMEIGSEVDTLYNARTEGRSVTFPRVSPDGRWLVYTLSDYGTFSIWHKDADLYMVDLSTGESRKMSEVNSDDVESYHSWSSNSRWMVVSSRRGDGLYTRPYFTYIDTTGKATKPMLLPQRDPQDYYMMQGYSYNIPEFAKGQIEMTAKEADEAVRGL